MANYDEANPLVRILPCKGDRGVNTGATVVTSASDMTDTTKAYLYAGTTGGDYTKGHWYYWDGTEWKDGGDYTLAVLETEVDPESANAVESQAIAAALDALEAQIPSIDDTLTVQGAGADAAVVGERISEIETNLNIGLHGIEAFPRASYVIDSNGKWTASTGRHISIPITSGDIVSITANSENTAVCAFLKSDNAASNIDADFCSGATWGVRKEISASETASFTAPSDCTILYVAIKPSGDQDLTPKKIEVNGADLCLDIRKETTNNSNNLSVLMANYGEVESANFEDDALAYTNDGYLVLTKDTGNETHQNFVVCKSYKSVITRVRFTSLISSRYSMTRPFIQDSIGKKITFVIRKTDGRCDAYVDEAFSVSIRATETFSTNPITDGTHVFDLVVIGTTILISVDGVYSYKIELSQYISGVINKVGFNYRGYGTSNQSAYKGAEIYCREKFAHISFDDQLDCLKDITDNSYESIFESPYFSVLKEAHDAYGAKFTLELFYQDAATSPTFALTGVTDSFKQEFIDNSGWLKFAYHGPDPTTKLNEMSDADLLASFENMYTQIKRFAGRCNIDTTPRLSNFRCTRSQALALKSNGYITGYLAADDDRSSNTGLSEAENAIAETHDIYTDFANGISYFRTGTRFDNGTAATVDAAIAHVLADEASRQNDSIYIIFAHTYTSELMISKLNALCEWCISRGLPFGYPFEHVEY